VSFALRRATAGDAPLLAEHRGRVWREVGDWDEEPIAAVIPVWTAWMREAVSEATYVAWIVEDAEGEVLGSGAVLVHVAIPRPGFPSDREGRVQSVYVVPNARRRGIAHAVMAEVMDYARAAMLIRLTLHPSEEARPLYAALGFSELDEMGLRLTGE
jgi:GNAT superfamily N-acetyltransferase